MNKIRINQGRIISGSKRTMFTAAMVAGMIAIFFVDRSVVGFLACLILSFLLIILWTSFKILDIDLKKGTYKKSQMILASAFVQETGKFDSVEGVIISQDTVTYRHVAHVRLRPQKDIFLISDETMENLTERLKPLLKKLGTDVVKDEIRALK